MSEQMNERTEGRKKKKKSTEGMSTQIYSTNSIKK